MTKNCLKWLKMNLIFINIILQGSGFLTSKFLQDIDKGWKRVILISMLQSIKKFFSLEKKEKKNKSKNGKNTWAEKQFKEMGKLGGKLILM